MDWRIRLYTSVTPNKKIFCNVPWYQLHVYWDGSLGICCTESHKLYGEQDKQYNIRDMGIMEWFNSGPVRDMRLAVLGDSPVSLCQRCYLEEAYEGHSRRIRENQKSVIFMRQAFDESFTQSPGFDHFAYSHSNQGYTQDTWPIDMHVDLGNHCNLACKMCGPKASSTIASQHVKWGIESSRQYLGTDWTKDAQAWQRFMQDLLVIPKLKNIHFMGGETLLSKRFEEFIDFMTAHKRFDLNFSFVTNGTVWRPDVIEKLKKFNRVGIEISIETLTEHNTYIRQGTDTALVTTNIDRYLSMCNGSTVTLALRPAPSALSIGYFTTVLRYALEKKLVVKSTLCYRPEFLHAGILPYHIRQKYLVDYQDLLGTMENENVDTDYNLSDPANYQYSIKEQAVMCANILSQPGKDEPALLEQMVRHCEKWDQVYGLDAWQLYPEFRPLLKQHAYQRS